MDPCEFATILTTSLCEFTTTFTSNLCEFSTDFITSPCYFAPEFSISGALREYADYGGDYEITPMITSQRLDTADRHMLRDVTIYTIPTQEINNGSGGTTFVIGGK